MKITKYDEYNEILPEGLKYSWTDEQDTQQYTTWKPSKYFRGIITAFVEQRDGVRYFTRVKDGDLILTSGEEKEIVKKGTLAHKYMTEKFLPKFKVGDRVRTNDECGYESKYYLGEGTVTEISKTCVKVTLDGHEYSIPYDPNEIDLIPTVDLISKNKEAQDKLIDKWKPYLGSVDNKLLTSQLLENQQKYVSTFMGVPVQLPAITDPYIKSVNWKKYYDAFTDEMTNSIDKDIIDTMQHGSIKKPETAIEVYEFDFHAWDAFFDSVKEIEARMRKEILTIIQMNYWDRIMRV